MVTASRPSHPPPGCARKSRRAAGARLLLTLYLQDNTIGRQSVAASNPGSDARLLTSVLMDTDDNYINAFDDAKPLELKEALIVGLHDAIDQKKSSYVKTFIEKGQKVWDKYVGQSTLRLINQQQPQTLQSPIMHAVLAGKLKTFQMLLDKDADVTIPEKDGYTVFHGAGFQGRDQIAERLIDAGVQEVPHSDGYKAFHRACWGREKRHTKTVQVFIDAGVVAYNEPAANGKTCAEMTNNEQTKKYLKTAQKAYEAKQKQEKETEETDKEREKQTKWHENLNAEMQKLRDKGVPEKEIQDGFLENLKKYELPKDEADLDPDL
ncbi:unnamed protein product [Amoebophrya sp. A120]|nr:unnamed protein product [Amoebophrya sp. A120]|eukprot:GSA120T00006381001.1